MYSSTNKQHEYSFRLRAALVVWGACIALLSGLVACGAEEEPEGNSDTQTDAAADVSPDSVDDGDDTSPLDGNNGEPDAGEPDTDESDADEPDVSTPEDTGDDETTDEDVQPDTAPDVREPDPAAVAQALDRASVQAYRSAASEGGDITSCDPDQPAAGGEDTCSENDACDDGLVCRNIRSFGHDSRCSCVSASGCADITCGAGQLCIPGTSSSQTLCGGGLNTVLCNDACVPGTCTSDDDCDADERCIVVRDVCGYLSGLACTPTAGSGCLGIDEACSSDETCLPSLMGEWSCVSTAIACD